MAAVSDRVKLLGARGTPFVNRVQFALNLKSVDYEFLIEKYPKSELLLKSNPVHKKVPVFIHGDRPICESLVIVEYIDETWPECPSILPDDPFDRATARFWAAYVDAEWHPLMMELNSSKDDETKIPILEKMAETLKVLEDVLVKCNEGKGYFGGESLGLIDLTFGCFLGWIKVSDVINAKSVKLLDETRTPALVAWVHRFTNHEAVKGTLPETEELLELRRAMKAQVRSLRNTQVPTRSDAAESWRYLRQTNRQATKPQLQQLQTQRAETKQAHIDTSLCCFRGSLLFRKLGD